METKSKRIYPSSQLICCLDARVLKCLMWILGWQSQGSIKYYPKQFAKACKMTEEEVDLCIETLVNTKLLDVSKVDQTYMLTPNAEQFQKYYDVPMYRIEHNIPVEINNHNLESELNYFVDCLIEGKTIEIDGVQGCNTVIACNAIVDSSTTGKKIRPTYVE